MRPLAVLLAAFCLAGCQDSAESLKSDFAKVERFAEGHRSGTSADAFLVREGLFGTERVALFYAYADDMEACLEVAIMFMRKYPDTPYNCEPAN